MESRTPQPYMVCYCNLCCKTSGGGGFAINIMGLRKTLEVKKGEDLIRTYQASLTETESGKSGSADAKSKNVRHFCSNCASYLFITNEEYPEWCYPFASAIDTPLPMPEIRHHIMLEYKRPWVPIPPFSPSDVHFDFYPESGIQEFHEKHGLLTD